MIVERQTVFVVGAGGSKPYGLPTGAELRATIIGAVFHGQGPDPQLSAALGQLVDRDHWQRLGGALRGTGPLSVDALLERRPDLGDVGRRAIAATLLKGEALSSFDVDGDWLGYVYRQMQYGAGLDQFGDNRVAFVTFNYDRLIEHRLTLALALHHGITLVEAWERVQKFPIVHPYGQLGSYWPDEEEGYVGLLQDRKIDRARTPQRIEAAAIGIRLMGDRREDDGDEDGEGTVTTAFGAARHVLSEAERVIFLGFGFDRDNLARLRVSTRCRPNDFFGSGLGLAEGEEKVALRVARECFRGQHGGQTVRLAPTLRSMDSLSTLRHFADRLS